MATEDNLTQRFVEQERLIRHLQALLTEREAVVQFLYAQLNSITRSKGWAIFQRLWNVWERLRFGAASSEFVGASEIAEIEYRKKNRETAAVEFASRKQEAESEPAGAVETAESSELARSLLDRSREALNGLRGEDIRAIAFYLPQYHPIPENDRWWGKGFTEWTNVSKARPTFIGHYQPHLPADLGFYDLRVPEVREQQAELAREYGIGGFCYYHYWFGGRRLLERPFHEVLSSGRPDFPFCICWANENWTRRWDGSEAEILMAQQHSDEDDRNFIRSLFPSFEDRRYIRINGKPLLMVYRAAILPDARRTAEIWRQEMRAAGLGEIYLCAVQSFGILDPIPYGFDAAAEFPPHGTPTMDLTVRIPKSNLHFAGEIHDYLSKADSFIYRLVPEYTLFKTVMPAWDNTPRRQDTSVIYINSSPEAYEYWLCKVVEQTIRHRKGDEQLVFINAWNEWGEGAHLEPDRRYGHRYLEATRNVLNAVRGN
jgi:lipopolysaccharide biosynthesis protein